MRCALCGRVTLNPAAMIGAMPVGPVCAKRAGLTKPRKRKAGAVVVLKGRRVKSARAMTLDLFPDLA